MDSPKSNISSPRVWERKRQCMYIEDTNMTYESVTKVNEYEKYNRENNEDPSSFFTNEFCHICGQEGDLLICENCPKVFHLKCLGLTYRPKEEFICKYCSNQAQHDCA